MGRLVLIDAYNVCYRLWPDLTDDPDEVRRRLVRQTEAALRAGGRAVGGIGRALLVFDARPGTVRIGQRSRSGDVGWLYAHGSADDEILDQVHRREGRSGEDRVVVVTDDRELGGRARQRGAKVLGVNAFYAGVRLEGGGAAAARPRPPGGGPPLTPRDFGLPEGPIDLDRWDPFEDD
jgi:predicted RNA-binding protein with PIN domain